MPGIGTGGSPGRQDHVKVGDLGAKKPQGAVGHGRAALSLDAMASVAYGPEAIVLVLAAAGAHGLGFTLPVRLAIAGLLAVLVASYRQVIAAFPDGGGSYAVSKTQLGARTSLVAAASLVLDYVLNVAVTVTAGVAAPPGGLAPAVFRRPGGLVHADGSARRMGCVKAVRTCVWEPSTALESGQRGAFL